MRRVYLYLFLTVTAGNIFLSGGRIASSDELSVFLTTESLVERGELSIDPHLVSNGIYGRDGKFYFGSGILPPILGIPFYLTGKAVANIADFSESLKSLSIRAAVSLANQVVAGFIAVVMFAFALKMGYSRKLSLFLTMGLLLTTNLFPYLKSFMREPQLLLYLLSAVYFLYCFKVDKQTKHVVYAGIFVGLGFLTRITFAIAIPFLFLYLLAILIKKQAPKPEKRVLARSAILFVVPIILAIGVDLICNYVQFGSIFTSGYSGRVTFSTPFYVGIYGLLFSSGKSFFLYAPLAVLTFAAAREFASKFRHESYLFIALFLVHLIFFGRFVAWAGDGSWGPRYLIPTLPFWILPIGVLLQNSSVAKKAAVVLAGIGLIIQLGGVSIYLGNYLREIGEYPYTKSFDNPEFMYKSHFIPNYSPIVGHWEMLIRNVDMALSGQHPDLMIRETQGRVPLSDETKFNLVYTLDFWFMYGWYAGVRPAILIAAFVLLLGLTCFFGYKTRHALSTTTLSIT